MAEAWFRFKGIDSRSYGILISAAGDRARPERRVEEVEIPGRNGSLFIDENTYEAYTVSLECGTRGTEKLDDIVTWLQGSGDLILSTEPDKIYRASIYNKISLYNTIYLYNRFLLQFKVQPFKYSVNAVDHAVELTEATTLFNIGTVYSQPSVTVFGSGNIVLNINEKEYALRGVDGSITIDSEAMEVYKGTENQNSKYASLEFPKLEVGENAISWSGEVTKIEIIPKWRWL